MSALTSQTRLLRRRHKHDTDIVSSYLASTSKEYGCPRELLSTVEAPVEVVLKGKARKPDQQAQQSAGNEAAQPLESSSKRRLAANNVLPLAQFPLGITPPITVTLYISEAISTRIKLGEEHGPDFEEDNKMAYSIPTSLEYEANNPLIFRDAIEYFESYVEDLRRYLNNALSDTDFPSLSRNLGVFNRDLKEISSEGNIYVSLIAHVLKETAGEDVPLDAILMNGIDQDLFTSQYDKTDVLLAVVFKPVVSFYWDCFARRDIGKQSISLKPGLQGTYNPTSDRASLSNDEKWADDQVLGTKMTTDLAFLARFSSSSPVWMKSPGVLRL
ncbi:hypothetical protein DL768_008136 [Monosporascus sp. mg162]|nr:hypothetical protein DL768_008136 [Monosporascus sp. mg162]